MIDLSNLVFMDFEASAGRDGYPVEVGWSWVEGNIVYFDSLLIVPADEWLTPAFSWDPVAQSIHGLSMHTLQAKGQAVSLVCQTLNHNFQNRIVTFDTGPDGVDRYWMDLLFAEGMAKRAFKLAGPAGELLRAMGDYHRLPVEIQIRIKASAPTMTHRAADDAAHYAWRAAAIEIAAKQENPLIWTPPEIEMRGRRRTP